MCILKYFLLITILAFAMTRPVYAAEGKKAEAEGTKKEENKDDKKEAKGEEGEKSKESSDISGGRFAGDPVYVHLAPLVLPVITASGNQQIVTIQIDIEVKSFDVADDIHTNISRINDSLVRSLYGGLSDGDLRNGKLVNINKVKARATSAISDVVGKGNVRNVLIQGIAQRLL